jgi:hypothetical protein
MESILKQRGKWQTQSNTLLPTQESTLRVASTIAMDARQVQMRPMTNHQRQLTHVFNLAFAEKFGATQACLQQKTNLGACKTDCKKCKSEKERTLICGLALEQSDKDSKQPTHVPCMTRGLFIHQGEEEWS